MNVLSHGAISKTYDLPFTRSPVSVCMYVRSGARTDVRVMREATALTEAGFVVTIVDVERDQSLPAEEEISGVRVKHIRMPDWFIQTRFKPWFLLKMVRMLFLSVSRLLQTPAEIYHAHDDTALLACSIAARLRGKPLVFDAHELPLFQNPLATLNRRQRLFHGLSRYLLAYLVPKCTSVITVSPSIGPQLALYYHASAVTVIRNVPPYQTVDKSDALRQHLDLDPSVHLALYQGGLHLSRGPVELIRAAAFFDSDIVLVLMGNGSPETLSQLEALIASEGVTKRVKIIPAVPYQELLTWTASADIGLIVYAPDYSLNVRLCLPNKLFEYLMAGLPVLASQLDAVAEVLTAYACGQVVSSLAPAAIALAINNMLEKRDALTQMHHNALRAAQEEFLWEKERHKLVQLYSDIAELKNNMITRPPIKVCMHVLGCARTDMRVMREATALVEAGFDVSIVDIECDRELPFEEELRGVHIRHLILPNWLTPTRFKPWFLLKLAQAFLYGALQMMHITADIYHAHDEISLPACYIAARLRHKPLIFDAHELPLSEPSVNRWPQLRMLAMRLLTHFISYCAGVITVSAPIAAKIGGYYHRAEVTLVRNIPPYHVVAKTDHLRQYLGLGPETRIALYQGGLSPDRGLDRLIRAARFLDDDHLLVIMGDGPQSIKTELATLIASEEVADRVKIIPSVPYKELLAWTGSATIGLIIYSPDYSPNVNMCLPNKLFEYMMAGLPILASQLEAVADIINSFCVGHVLSSLEPCAIAQAINEMLTDKIALQQMQHNALSIAQRDFCWEKEQKQLLQLYHTILATSI